MPMDMTWGIDRCLTIYSKPASVWRCWTSTLVVLLAMMGAKAVRSDMDARAKHDAAEAEKRAAKAREARARSRAGFEPGASFLGDN